MNIYIMASTRTWRLYSQIDTNNKFSNYPWGVFVAASKFYRNSLVYVWFTVIAESAKFLCIEFPCRLVEAIRRKRPEKLRKSSWFAHHENAPAHRPVLVKNFLTKNNVTIQ